ncbi:MAG: RNA polymerase sigma factor [Deltaproteobacteria bacterium]|nr:RNA polymerase sigma factor [Deltaproteobacteria bacterium]
MGLETENLVGRCLTGDADAFRELYRTHRPHVARLVQRILGPDSEVEDVIQEAFIQIHRSLPSFQGSSLLSTWIHRVAVNVALQHIRRRKRQRSGPVTMVAEPPEPSSGDPAPEEDVLWRDRMRKLYAALDTLSPKKRAVFVLHEIEGMSAEDIAKTMHAPLITVRTRLFYARKALYALLAADPSFHELVGGGGG